jgi:hypothetical protein
MPTKINSIPYHPEELKKLFRYDETTGKLYNKITRSSGAQKDMEAGTLNRGYRVVGIDGVVYLVHRIIWKMMTGNDPIEQLDHINHNGLDNRMENLREVTNQENHKNQRISCNNTSGTLGVNWSSASKKWRAYITVDGKQIHLGLFKYYTAAVKARKDAEFMYDYSPNHGDKKK